MNPQILTFPEVARLNIEKIDSLGCFNGHHSCFYVYADGCRCAVGCGLSDEIATKIEGLNNINDAICTDEKVKPYFQAASTLDLRYLRQLQTYHDDACRNGSTPTKEQYKATVEQMLSEYYPLKAKEERQ